MASQDGSNSSKEQMLKRENVVMIIPKLSFHLLRIKTFHVLNVLFLEESLQRASRKLPSPNLETPHKNYENIPLPFFQKKDQKHQFMKTYLML